MSKQISPQTQKLIQNCLKANNIGPNAVHREATGLKESTKFAVLMMGPVQYKVTQGDVFAVGRIHATIGSKIAIKKVMIVGGAKFTAIGRPFLEGVRVICDVEENKSMRNVPFVTRPRGMSIVRWWDSNSFSTILRVREIQYEPVVVGELDKYQGNLIDPTVSQRPLVSEDLDKPIDLTSVHYENMPMNVRDEFQSETAEFFEHFVPSRVQQQQQGKN
jgi:large subunit ribosomal protein L21